METLNSSTLQAKYTQVALKKESIYESFAYHLIIHVFGAIKKRISISGTTSNHAYKISLGW